MGDWGYVCGTRGLVAIRGTIVNLGVVPVSEEFLIPLKVLFAGYREMGINFPS